MPPEEVPTKPFRRVRKHIGETWRPRASKAITEPGIWCPSCQSRHAYKSKKTLGATFEKRQGVWHILWFCKSTGNVLKDEGVQNGQR
jgi:DNA-directed RNA polymerase subunit RPC12/RpoP